MTENARTVGGTASEPATVSDVVADYLSAAGIPYVFGYPGTPNIEFMEQATRRGIEIILARREGTAGAMAEAFAMCTGLPGVCMSTLGPGSTSLVSGVAGAFLDRVPMLAISGQVGTAREPYFTHQVIDHHRLFAPVAKWVTRLEPASAGIIMRKALRVAVAERPGPVHLTGNADVMTAPVEDPEVVLPPMQAETGSAMTIARSDASPADHLLSKSRRPVLLAGMAALRSESTDALIDFSENVGCPIVVSPMAKGVVPEYHPYFAGTLDMACNEVVWEFLARADLILAVGFDAVELIKPWQLRTNTVHIDAVPNTDQIYRADLELVGDIPSIVTALRSDYSGEPRWEPQEVAEHRRHLRERYYEGRVPDRLNPTDVIDALQDASPPEATITTDVGSHKLLVGQGWLARHPRTVLMTNGLSAMGFALPAAIAAKLARPGDPVVATVGDGGFAMVQGELRLASSLNLGIVVVVFGDDSLNRIELKQMSRGYDSVATRFDPTDIPRVAEAMGCFGERVEDSQALRKVLDDTAGLSAPLVIEARIDPSQYASQF